MLAQAGDPLLVIVEGGGANHHELVAAQPADDTAGDESRQPLAEARQQAIAAIDAQAVVDRLEAVDVDQRHVQPFTGTQPMQPRSQQVVQPAAIGQPGQRVLEADPAQILLARLVPGNVGEQADVVADPALVAGARLDPQPFGVLIAMLALIPDFAFPAPDGIQGLPVAFIERLVVAPGRQRRGIQPQHFLAGVAGDLGEGRVHADDAVVPVGNDHSITGQLERLFAELTATMLALDLAPAIEQGHQHHGQRGHAQRHQR